MRQASRATIFPLQNWRSCGDYSDKDVSVTCGGASRLMPVSVHATASRGGNARLALERAREFLSLAQSQTDTGLLLMGNRLTGVSLIDMGDFPLALSHLDNPPRQMLSVPLAAT